MRAIDWAFLLAWSAAAGLAIAAGPSMQHRDMIIAGDLAVALSFATMPWWTNPWSPRTTLGLRTILCMVLIPFMYSQLGYSIPALWHGRSFEAELKMADQWLFGVEPSDWLMQYAHPLLTEILQMAYSSFYFLALGLGIPFWLAKRNRELAITALAVSVGFYLSYIGYVVYPARSPIIAYHAGIFPPGMGLSSHVALGIQAVQINMYDAFPSGHTEVSLVILVYARRLHPPAFRVLLPIVSLLILATVYLRYHYVVDVLAGFVLAFIVVRVVDAIIARLSPEEESVPAITALQ